MTSHLLLLQPSEIFRCAIPDVPTMFVNIYSPAKTPAISWRAATAYANGARGRLYPGIF